MRDRNCCGLETVDYPRRSTSWETWIRRGHLRRVITRSASPPPHHPAGSASAVRSAPFPLSPSAPPLHKESHYARWARLGLLRTCWAGVRGRPLHCSIFSPFSMFTDLFVPIMTPSFWLSAVMLSACNLCCVCVSCCSDHCLDCHPDGVIGSWLIAAWSLPCMIVT